MTSLNSLIEKLATGVCSDEPKNSDEPSGLKTDPVYVEKLASAIDYIVDIQKEPTSSQTPSLIDSSVGDMSTSLRSKLQTKLAEKSKEGSNETALVQNVLNRLKALKHSPTEEIEEVFEEKTAEVEDVFTEADTSGNIDDLSLADILQSALSADEIDESVPSEESVKTAEDRGESPMARKEATSMLKNRLLAKLGQEAGHGTT